MNKTEEILDQVEKFFSDPLVELSALESLSEEFLNALEKGHIRTARKNSGNWQVDPRVKKGILLAFKVGQKQQLSFGEMSFVDKANLWPRKFSVVDNLRVVPFASAVRRGAYVGQNVTLMPPSYVNIGAYVDDDSMIDSHALVGSCAQIGKKVHISAAAQIGGVLEPVGAMPVIIEDKCLIGGNCGIYEGTLVGERAVIGAGVILTQSVKVYDLVNEKVISASPGENLKIPAGAVVVPGTRALIGGFAKEHGLSVMAPQIIKYRDSKTDQKIRLEDYLR